MDVFVSMRAQTLSRLAKADEGSTQTISQSQVSCKPPCKHHPDEHGKSELQGTYMKESGTHHTSETDMRKVDTLDRALNHPRKRRPRNISIVVTDRS